MGNQKLYNYRKCVICGVRKFPESNILLSSFPLDPDRCRLWVKAAGDEDLAHLPIEKLHQLKFICGCHFVLECFNERRNRLLKSAVPTEKLTKPPLSDDYLKEFPLHIQSFYTEEKRCQSILDIREKMSVKRQASTQLNHENWDQDDPAEQEDETGGFKMASKEVLEKRVIRTAKRRTQASGDEVKRSVFSGFSGFNKTQPTSFDFLAKLTNGNNANNGAASKSETLTKPNLFNTTTTSSFGSGIASISGTTASLTTSTFGKTTTESSLFGFATTNSGFTQSVFSSSRPTTTAAESPFKIQSTQSPTLTTSVTSKLNTSDEKPTPQVSSNIFGSSSTAASSAKSLFSTTSNKSTPVKAQPVSASPSSETNTSTNKSDTKGDHKLIYFNKLKGLNQSVSDWIKKHVEETPLCILTPIFRDYDKYLKEIQEEYEKSKEKTPTEIIADTKQNNVNTEKSSSLFTTSSNVFSNNTNSASSPVTSSGITTGMINSPNTSMSTFTSTVTTTSFTLGTNSSPNTSISNFGNTETTSSFTLGMNSSPNKSISNFGNTAATSSFTMGMNNSTNTSISNFSSPPSGGFSFGAKTTTANTSPFSLNTSTNNATGSTPFSFGIGKPFSFNSNIQKTDEPVKEADDKEDEPPKVEYTPIVEENSVYDKKCKVFVKKDGNFVDKGVGTLYIKKIEESGKHQLLVRANTALGNVLMNLILSSSLPTQRMGKNNVMMVCIPTPDAKPPPTSILIRVKTSEEADELLETLNKYKA